MVVLPAQHMHQHYCCHTTLHAAVSSRLKYYKNDIVSYITVFLDAMLLFPLLLS